MSCTIATHCGTGRHALCQHLLNGRTSVLCSKRHSAHGHLHVHAAEQLADICEARTADAAANAAIAAGGIVLPAGKQHRRRGGLAG